MLVTIITTGFENVISINQVFVSLIAAALRARQKSDKIIQLYIHECAPVWMHAQEVTQDKRDQE